MPYLLFGIAIGAFVSGLIEKYHKPEEESWIKAKYLFGFSALSFIAFLYTGWPLLKRMFE